MRAQPLEPGEVLAWDSGFFGFRIGRLNNPSFLSCRSPSLKDWVNVNQLAMAYCLVDTTDEQPVAGADSARFRCVDVRHELRQTLKGTALPELAGNEIRLARPEDIPALRAIAGSSHGDSRFYHDARFPRERCDELYRVWIENSCRGQAEAVWVVEVDGQVSGYISCHLDGAEAGRIGLFAVAASAQGRGLGSALINRALRWFQQSDRSIVSVVTQGRNSVAQRIYQKSGFQTTRLGLWYHVWFVSGPGDA